MLVPKDVVYQSPHPPHLSSKVWITQLLGWGNLILEGHVETNVFFFRQVFLVQVNPGETFTIRAEDGTLQCIQGKRIHERVDDVACVMESLFSHLYKNVMCSSENTVKHFKGEKL